jgi:hypothetical protein
LFFIVGRGRSGTTLLSRMLSRHPHIAVAPEGMFAMNLQGEYRTGPWNDRRIYAFCRALMREQRMRDWELDLERLAQRLHDREGTLDYARVCLEVYLSHAEDSQRRRGIQWVGDKNPHYALLIGRLHRLFPAARYVYITRDYRDNITSYAEMPFDLDNWAALAQRWKEYNEEILKLSRRVPERFLWLRYEDLVTHPEHELTRVCRFLGLEYDAAMLSFAAADRSGAAVTRTGRFIGVRHPIDASEVAKWRARLPERVVRRADTICGELGERFGYHPTTLGEQPLSLAARLGTLYGSSSVLLEKALFSALPARLRVALINSYRAFTRSAWRRAAVRVPRRSAANRERAAASQG